MKIKKIINLAKIHENLAKVGLNQAKIADELAVSRETVSKWFKGENQPSGGKLLKLASLLKLSFEEILTLEISQQPVIHFRKNGSAKTSEIDREAAIEMGNALEKLVCYFPLNFTTKPAVLQHTKNDYGYINEFIDKLKKEMNLTNEILTFNDIISIFYRYNSVIIPVLWKENRRHVNALRVYLPESMSTWIYLNLNTKLYDFKFWMAHELGHVLAPDLHNEEGEVFSDSFAGALLFPKSQVEVLYNKLIGENSERQQIHLIIEKAKELVISPLSVYMQLCAFTECYKKTKIDLNHLIYKFNSKFNSYFPNVATKLFNTESPTPEQYINYVNSKFVPPFFVYLKKYIEEMSPSSYYIQNLLDISLVDARNIQHALINPK